MSSWFLQLLVARALLSTTTSLIRPMTSYRALALGGDATSVGFIAAAFGLVPMLLAVPLGRRMDHGSSERYILGGLLAAMTASALLAATERIWQVVALSALLGLGNLAAVLASQAVLAARFHEREHDRRFGLFTMGASFGQLAGPLIGGYVADQSTKMLADGAHVPLTMWSFLAGAAMAAGGAACAVGLRGGAASRWQDTATEPTMRQIWRTSGIVPAVFVSLSFVACINVLIVYLPVLGEQRGLSASMVGILLAFRAAASMLSRAWVSGLVRLLGRQRLLVASMLVAAAGVALVPLPRDIVLVGLLFTVTGFFLGVGSPLTLTWIAQLVSPQVRGTALAIRLTGNRVGQAAIPAVAGVVAVPLGVFGVFWLIGSLLVTASLMVLHTGRGNSEPTSRDE